MIKKLDRKKVRTRKHKSIRRRIVGTAERPRLSVFRSLQNIWHEAVRPFWFSNDAKRYINIYVNIH